MGRQKISSTKAFQDTMLLQIYIDFESMIQGLQETIKAISTTMAACLKRRKLPKSMESICQWHHTTMSLIHIMNIDIYCRRLSGALIGIFRCRFYIKVE